MTNLGEKLKKIKEDIKNRETEELRRKDEAERKRVHEAAESTNKFFQKAWDEAVESIEANKPPKGIVVRGYDLPFRQYFGSNFNIITPDDINHKHHNIFLAFERMASKEGLKLFINYEHDGQGMDSWYRIIFTV